MLLSEDHLSYLAARGISDPMIIEARGYRTVATGLEIPVCGLPDGETVSHEIRLDNPDTLGRKFDRPSGSGNRLNVNRTMLSKVQDIRQTLIIVEGTTRADALAERGMAAISLTGCWGWVDAKRGPLPEWRDIPLRGRKVIWIPDGDVISNTGVNKATREFIAFMGRKGATVQLMELPGDQGLDDWLAAGHTLLDMAQLLIGVESLPELENQKLTREKLADKRGLPEITDAGLAELYALTDPTHSVRVAYTDIWYSWSLGSWVQSQSRDGLEARVPIAAFLKTVADRYEDEAEGDAEKAVAAGVRKDLLSAARLANVHARYKALPPEMMTVEEEDFDRDPYLFTCANGTLDLRTGDVRDHSPTDRLRGRCPNRYVSDAPRERWTRFLAEVFPGRPDVVAYLQRILGAALIGRPILHVLPVFIGTGRNGKGTLIRALTGAMGRHYMGACDNSLLISAKFEGHLTKVMALKGKRVVTASETEAEDAFAVAALKRYTGGDELSARNMRENQTTFMPSHSMILQTNHLPKVDVEDEALWARLRRIEFGVSFMDAPDTTLDQKLAGEAEGILAWLVEGCLAFIRDGEGEGQIPESVLGDTIGWRVEDDQFLSYTRENLIKDPKGRVGTSELLEHYRKWCQERGEQPEYQGRKWGAAMKRYGAELGRTNRERFWSGARLGDPESVTMAESVTESVTIVSAGQSAEVTEVTDMTDYSAINIGDPAPPTTPPDQTESATPKNPSLPSFRHPTPPDQAKLGDGSRDGSEAVTETCQPHCENWSLEGRVMTCTTCGYTEELPDDQFGHDPVRP